MSRKVGELKAEVAALRGQQMARAFTLAGALEVEPERLTERPLSFASGLAQIALLEDEVREGSVHGPPILLRDELGELYGLYVGRWDMDENHRYIDDVDRLLRVHYRIHPSGRTEPFTTVCIPLRQLKDFEAWQRGES